MQYARPATPTGQIARAAVRGTVGFAVGSVLAIALLAFIAIAFIVFGIVAVAFVLSHLPADTLPPPGQ